MALDTPEAPKANGLKTALDIIIAPKDALESLRLAPTWGWALVLTLVLFAIGNFLVTPAVIHGMQADWPHTIQSNPQLAQMTPEQQQRQLAIVSKFVQFAWLFTLIIAPLFMLIQTVIMYVFKIIGKGDGTFGQLWAANVNIAVPVMGINSLVTASIVLLRGPTNFNSAAEVQTAMPSLALLVPATAVKLHAFLALFNPFVLWGVVLGAATMMIVARVSRVWAWTTAIIIFLISAGLATLGAR